MRRSAWRAFSSAYGIAARGPCSPSSSTPIWGTAPNGRSTLNSVLARLTFDGRIDREETAAFLARIEQGNFIDDGDMTWWGWEEAVVSLGLTELEPALRRVWSKPIYEQHEERDHTERLEAMRRAAADPSDPFAFKEEDIRAIEDPVEAVSWIEHRAAAMLAWEAEHAAENGPEVADLDVAKDDIRLTPEEQQWLGGLLASRQVPATTMSLEMLDGFFTALVIGPELVLPSQYLPVVWGSADGEGRYGTASSRPTMRCS
jgi:hypothetical protein